jgi:hypothetical protein
MLGMWEFRENRHFVLGEQVKSQLRVYRETAVHCECKERRGECLLYVTPYEICDRLLHP